jgi:hypothetical protein
MVKVDVAQLECHNVDIVELEFDDGVGVFMRVPV